MSDLTARIAQTVLVGKNAQLSGLSGTSKAFLLQAVQQRLGRPLIYVAGEEELAFDAARTLRGLLSDHVVLHLPPRDYLAGGREALSPSGRSRIVVLSHLADRNPQPRVVVTSAPALLFSTTSPEAFLAQSMEVRSGSTLVLKTFLERLVQAGYTRCTTVEEAGQFAMRGGILDLYPINAEAPVRIELFGDEIESIRTFAVDNQRSKNPLKTVTICPATERSAQEQPVWSYFGADWPVWLDEPARFRDAWAIHTRRYKTFLQQVEDRKLIEPLKVLPIAEFQRAINQRPAVYHAFFPQSVPEVPFAMQEHITQREGEPLWARPGALTERLQEWKKKNYQIYLAVSASARKHLTTELTDAGMIGTVTLTDWRLDKGFVSTTLKTAVVTEKDIFGKRGARSQQRKGKEPGRITAGELSVGDFVVHENHGIGIFKGMTRMEVEGAEREYLVLQYAGTDRLYLPVDKLNLLSRYSGADTREPKLSKLGGTDWERTKKRVKESIQELAGELLALYAAREQAPGHAYSHDTIWQKEFEESFEYEDTPDQGRAVAEVKRDMERKRPMDRLVCGDVGYGKTEVAMRAAFKAVMDKKQVAVLVPTTVLAEQHFHTFSKRLENYPITVEVLSRFKTAGQQKRVLEDLKRGMVDMVIGTHRLLSNDVVFRELGLLIIDEEHRFGVRQKEKVKALKQTVDVLTLSATPIPRSLHMAMTGLRDLSVIETPPPDRYPITTYVMEYNPELVSEALEYELGRGGQVFYVHNRINDIERVKREVESLMPGLRVSVAHGRMNEEELSRVMRSFMQGESDVLLCTTIIESGLDLPNVNTLIVDQADHMGLAQLYQIRGRVGRSNRLAYAYLTYRPDKALSEVAQKRLNAIREFTELGSGMKIALRDLEIRGAGNILGPEQHGHIEAVGFDLYCRLLEEETAKYRGEATIKREAPSLDVRVDTHIPDDYIAEPAIKIQYYKQVMLAENPDAVSELERDMEDRFGPVPVVTRNLFRIARLRLEARDKAIKNIVTDRSRVELTLAGPLGQRAQGLMEMQDRYGFKISVSNQHTLILDFGKNLSLDALEDLMAII
ncbi:MAG: transcription-repair coupling factor [Solirubrobacterales bacterium]